MSDKKFSTEDVKKMVQELTGDLITRFTSELETPIADAGGGCDEFDCGGFNCPTRFTCGSSFVNTVQ